MTWGDLLDFIENMTDKEKKRPAWRLDFDCHNNQFTVHEMDFGKDGRSDIGRIETMKNSDLYKSWSDPENDPKRDDWFIG